MRIDDFLLRDTANEYNVIRGRMSPFTLVVNQAETTGKKSMDFFDWQGVRRPHGEPCNDEQRS